MKRMGLAALAPLAMLAGCGPDSQAVLETVHMTEQTVIDAIAADDLDGIMRNYDANAVLVASDGETEAGKPAIRATFERMLADPSLEVALTRGPAWASGSGELAVTTGTLRFTTTSSAGKPFTVAMRNQTVWQHEDGGSWKIVSDYNVAEPGPTT